MSLKDYASRVTSLFCLVRLHTCAVASVAALRWDCSDRSTRMAEFSASYYAVLGLQQPEFTEAALKKAYRVLALRWCVQRREPSDWICVVCVNVFLCSAFLLHAAAGIRIATVGTRLRPPKDSRRYRKRSRCSPILWRGRHMTKRCARRRERHILMSRTCLLTFVRARMLTLERSPAC